MIGKVLVYVLQPFCSSGSVVVTNAALIRLHIIETEVSIFDFFWRNPLQYFASVQK